MSKGLIIKEAFLENKISSKPCRVLLLGASVGQEWNLSDLPKRINNNKYTFEIVAVFSFDKSKALDEILMRPKRRFHFTRTYLKSLFKPALQKPNVIIIKECAAYFPGDLEKYKTLVQKWVSQIVSADSKPVLATVVPVTQEHSQKRSGRLTGILEYNDWIREYTRESGINCLDLEAALRISDKDRTLSPDLTSSDGLHLNRKAYDILDRILEDFLIKYTKNQKKLENGIHS